MRSRRPVFSKRRGPRRSRWSRPRRRTCPRCRTGSARRWSSWRTRSPTGTPDELLEVHREDVVGPERGGEALDLVLHVGARQPLEVADERLGAQVELLVEAVDGLLVVETDRVPLAVRAAELDLPVRRGGLLPLDRVHEALVAVRADMELEHLTRDVGRRLRRVG